MIMPMNEFNPYAAPEADLDASPVDEHHGVWRAGDDVIMFKDGEFPDRCVKCNQPADGWRLKRSLSWHPQGYYLLLLISPVIYVIVALVVRKTAKVRFPLCDEHRRRRGRAIGSGWLLALGGVACMIIVPLISSAVVGPDDDLWSVGGVLSGAALMLGGLIYGVLGSRVASTVRIDKRFVWLTNIIPEFVDSLPPYGA
jgi:hypothetical protein